MSAVEQETHVFELPGSKTHYPPSVLFIIEHMWLSVEPDFESKTLRCKQQLKLITKDDIDMIELDSVGLQVESVFFSSAAMSDGAAKFGKNSELKKLTVEDRDDKIAIDLGKKFLEDSRFHLIINYSTKPERGFYFVTYGENTTKKIQAWTQGEAADSKYWFPCLDHPQMKFPREISVIVPENFAVVSNGELDLVDTQIEGRKKYVWEESNPNPAYLTSIVIGEFVETSKGETYQDRIPLRYFVPRDREEDADRTFKDTPKMMLFFEQFFGMQYPYSKYSQITIEDFPYGGMENTTCTTLTTDLLHDQRAHMDYSSDDVIAHELAHHWFGDLVTCRDWQHIWLNEGFATYSEALYFEYLNGLDRPNIDEFQFYVLQMADRYIDETKRLYKRALVTKVYNNPDELFDVGHTYAKGGCVLHMIRNYIGDDDFRKSLKNYLEAYKNKTAETDDLRQVFEEISGKSLQQFFDQWVYRAGHPEIEVDFSLEETKEEVKVRITQTQEGDTFEFPVEIRIVFSDDGNDKNPETVMVSGKVTEESFKIPHDREIRWIAVDPDFKILKEIISIKVSQEKNNFRMKELLRNQLREGKTVYERIQAARALNKDSYSDGMIDSLKEAILKDKFWGLSVEAANTFGLMIDEPHDNKAYDALRECLASTSNPKIKTSLINAIGEFRRSDSFPLLKQILGRKDESYFALQAAAIGIGWTRNTDTFEILENLVKTTSFQEVVAQGALIGLTISALSLRDKAAITRIRDLLIDKSTVGNYHGLRETATIYLGYFVPNLEGDINKVVFNHIKELSLADKWVFVRNAACIAIGIAFGNTNNPDAIAVLEQVAENDADGQVKRTALENIRKIKSKKPVEVIQMIRVQDMNKLGLKLKSKEVEVMQKRIPRK
jgi:aminopeptidase N